MVVLVVTVLALGLLGLQFWLVVWLVRQLVATAAREMEIAQTILRPVQPPPPSRASEPPSMRAAMPRIDPTDTLIPDVDVPVGSLAAAFPRVDPWLIGEPELPETINDTEFNADDGPTQVMDADGNWVPLEEAT